MTKIAYLLAGHVRTHPLTNFKDIVKKYPGDVFMAPLDTLDVNSDIKIDDKYIERFNVTKYKIFNQNNIIYNSIYKHNPHLHAFIPAIFCNKSVLQMCREYEKSQNIKYDLICFMRFDMTYPYFDLSMPLANINEKNFIFVNKSTSALDAGLLADQIRVCSSDGADIWIKSLEKILEQASNNYSPESLTTVNLLDSGVAIDFIDSDIIYLRLDGTAQIVYEDPFRKSLNENNFREKAFNRIKRKDSKDNFLSAVYVLFDDFEFMDLSLQTVTQFCDKIFVLINKKSWRGDAQRDESLLQKEINFLKEKYPQVQIEHTDYENEHDQRNYGLDLSLKSGCDWCLVVDTDEVWEDKQLGTLRVNLKAAPADVIGVKSKIFTYWKFLSGEQSLYRIEPPEEFTPYLVVSTKIFRFNDKRNGESLIKDPKMLLGGEPWMHHFSYTRSDDYLLKKIATFSHSHEITQNWYEEKWLKWTPDMLDIHPTTPSQYKKAVKVDLNTLPKEIRDFFKAKK